MWAGVLAGWLLYAIFITGGISYFREELTQWLRPELPARPAVLDQAAATQQALATLTRVAAGADRWQLDLPAPRNNVIEASWERGDHRERALLSPADGAQLHPRATCGGEFFYYFHFGRAPPQGRRVAGVAALHRGRQCGMRGGIAGGSAGVPAGEPAAAAGAGRPCACKCAPGPARHGVGLPRAASGCR